MITQPLKRLAEIRFSNVDKKTFDGQVPVRLCNYTDVYYNDRIVADMVFMPATATSEQTARFSLLKGDVLLTKDSETADDIGVSALVAEDMPGVVCGYHLALVRPHASEVNGRYLRWAISSAFSRQQLSAAASGVTRFGLRQDAVGSLAIPVPSLREQRAIADYLDAETARIDALIAKSRKSVELLSERRKALIVGMFAQTNRSSERGTLRILADVLLGRQRSPEQAEGAHMVPYLRAANVKDGQLDLSDVMEMNFSPREQLTFALEVGDVLITEGAGSLAAVGANAVWNGELLGTMCFQNTLIRLRPKKGSDPRFVAWWARSAFESGLLGSVAGGANIYHLGVDNVRKLPVWAPPLSVQMQVADRLESEIGRLQDQARARQRQIALLAERRQALITAAVTGQLHIPGTAA